MFDLIDDLSTDVWEDKGSPPDDLNEIAEISEYENYHIVTRKPAPPPVNQVTYVVADDNGKNTKTITVQGTAPNVDPLKNVRHFRAKTTEQTDGSFLATAILLDMDWCVKK